MNIFTMVTFGAHVVGVDDSSTDRLGSVVVARPSRIRDVPGSIPGLAYLFSSYACMVEPY
jgi:hypothetical protein